MQQLHVNISATVHPTVKMFIHLDSSESRPQSPGIVLKSLKKITVPDVNRRHGAIDTVFDSDW